MDNDEILTTFFQECDDQLQVLEDGLSEMSESGANPDAINRVFRAVHSIKGGAASLDLPRLAHFAHSYENALSCVRSGDVQFTSDHADLFFSAMDLLADMVKDAREGTTQTDDQRIEECKKQLAEISGKSESEEQESGLPQDFKPLPVDFDFGDDEDKPEEASPEEDKVAKLQPPTKTPTLPVSDKKREETVKRSIDKILGSKGSPVKTQQAPQSPKKNLQHHSSSETIRVNLGKIDKLMNLVGELVIAQSSLENNELWERSVSHMESLVRELQESVMSIRAQPISIVFQRMKRVIREARAATKKNVTLILEGEHTEIDRTLNEHLVDPLTHILRNAVDHGIETPSEREKAGKNPQGRIILSAEQKSGRIVISVSDDGGGINREKVREIAVQRGLISADESLSEEDIDNLICTPGFSTNDTVTDLSGRGVGMDVVKSVIQSLGGRMVIQSKPGEGTRFDLSLPLTLAVMDGMLVKINDVIIVVPISMIDGITQNDGKLKSMTMPDGSEVIHIRDNSMPLFNMAQLLGFKSSGKEGCLLITEDESGNSAAFLVDDILDQKQVVIKSFEKNYHKIKGISGATILGDGSVSFIIDPGALVNG